MGCDIHGWVEIKDHPEDVNTWERALSLDAVLDRDYDVFGLLFGVRNYTGLEPIAEGRGLPPDASQEVKAEHAERESDAHSASYVTLAELEASDWERTGTDERVHQYGQNETGEWKPEAKWGWTSLLTPDDYTALKAGETVEKDGKRYQIGQITGKEIREGQLDRLIALMRLLADGLRPPKEAGQATAAERVRMVVWFDN